MTQKIEARILLLTNRIAADTIALAEAQAQLSAASLVSEVAAGFTVTFKVGRAETRREVTGVVQGRGEVKGVDSVRVQSGEGFDLEVYTIKVAELTSITAPNADKDLADLASDVHAVNPSAAAVLLGAAAGGVSEADELLNSLNG